MNNSSTNSATSIIPTAGYISKPQQPPKQSQNKKIIILFTALFSLIVIVAAIVAITTNASQPTVAETPEPNLPKAESPSRPPRPEAITNNAIQRNLAIKANRILTHGAIFNSPMRATSSAIFYTNEKVNEYFNHLDAGRKAAIVLAQYQSTTAPTLSDQDIAKLTAKNCQLLFDENNCRATTNTDTKESTKPPTHYQKINLTPAQLRKKTRELFGEVDALPQQLIDFCPHYTYIDELQAYLFHNQCGRSDYAIKYSYIYDFRSEDDKYYVYFTSGSLAVDQSTGKRSLLYQDMDAAMLLEKIHDEQTFAIDSHNYQIFQAYRLIFQKDERDNYVYQKLEIVND